MQDFAASLKARIIVLASDHGFQIAGVTDADDAESFERFLQWIEMGYAGEMNYLSQRRSAYQHPQSILPDAQSLILLAISYKKTEEPESSRPGIGRIASYATGPEDYHEVIWRRLNQIIQSIEREFSGVRCRGVVDTAPLLERDFARKAGLGWIGKNTLLLNRSLGSYFFLAAILIDHRLTPDLPFETNHCGTCTACLEACPTQAFVQPYVLDARRCISYLTIEHRSEIALELHQQMGDWIFGCDICQQVCPWNRRPEATSDEELVSSSQMPSIDVLRMLRMTPDQFRLEFRSTPLWRPRYRGMIRNAMIIATNQRLHDAIPIIEQWSRSEDEVLKATACQCLSRFALAKTGDPY